MPQKVSGSANKIKNEMPLPMMLVIRAQNAQVRADWFASAAPVKSYTARHEFSLHAITIETTPSGMQHKIVAKMDHTSGEGRSRRYCASCSCGVNGRVGTRICDVDGWAEVRTTRRTVFLGPCPIVCDA